MCTFAGAGNMNEHMIGNKSTGAKDMMQNLVNRLNNSQANASAAPVMED